MMVIARVGKAPVRKAPVRIAPGKNLPYAVIPVAWKVRLPIRAIMPAVAARRRNISHSKTFPSVSRV